MPGLDSPGDRLLTQPDLTSKCQTLPPDHFKPWLDTNCRGLRLTVVVVIDVIVGPRDSAGHRDVVGEEELDILGGKQLQEETEIGHLAVAGKVITVETGVRFLTDYLSGDEYFRVHGPRQNLDRCQAQFALAASIDRQMADMQRVVAGIVAGMKRTKQAG